ncbi:MAG: CotH kinase family protein [Lachnospiraceae bacterium]|nr:CotH kinase family protein [Lachnospiraceae bacterium]
MLAHKHITKIVAAIVAIITALCLSSILFADQLTEKLGDTVISMEYETALFDTDSIMSVNIIMDEDDWNSMLENAIEESYYECNIEINGTTFYRVGIRPKGNTSLTNIANDPTTDRYSFCLEFDHYVDGQTCFGLDKLILNNNYADATSMKEALIYDMYQYLGADASLYNYAGISVNGEYWGLYLALEGVEDSFMLRNYGVSNGELYKPESMNMGGGRTQGSMMGGGGANLNYTDDDADSYSTIWDGEVTKTGDADHKRVITALKNISEGTDLEQYMDVDNLLKYMAVHVFSVNADSLSGMMAHNYYLYEEDGKLNLIPWDYNLTLGGMGSGNDAADVINDPIDNAFSGTTFFDTLMENEEYHARYYAYLQQLIDEYLNGDGFENFYQHTRSLIDSYIESDPTAFYTYEEYQTAADTLYQVVKLRAESIEKQLDGTIPSNASDRTDADTLVDAEGLDLSVMGSMDTGGGGGKPGPSGEKSGSSDSGSEELDPSQMGGQMPGNFDSSQNEGQMPGNFDPTQMGDSAETKKEGFSPSSFGGQMPGGFPGQDSADTTVRDNAVTYGICFVILILALLFVKFYHRRNHRFRS